MRADEHSQPGPAIQQFSNLHHVVFQWLLHIPQVMPHFRTFVGLSAIPEANSHWAMFSDYFDTCIQLSAATLHLSGSINQPAHHEIETATQYWQGA